MPIQPKQIDELYGAYKRKKSPATLSPLMYALTPTIDKALKTYGYANDPNMGITARLHVAKVLDNFDPKKGASLPTFVFSELQRIQRLGAQQAHTIPIPEQAILDLKNISGKESELAYKLGRPATMDEISDATGVSTKRIGYIRSKYGQPTIMEGSFLNDEGASTPVGTAQGTGAEDLWNDLVYNELEPHDKLIMGHTLGIKGHEPMSKTQIATKLGISPAAVTQRAKKIATKLQESSAYGTLFGA